MTRSRPPSSRARRRRYVSHPNEVGDQRLAFALITPRIGLGVENSLGTLHDFFVSLHIDVLDPYRSISPFTVRIDPYLTHPLRTLESTPGQYERQKFSSWPIATHLHHGLSYSSFAYHRQPSCMLAGLLTYACIYTNHSRNLHAHSPSSFAFFPPLSHIDMSFRLYTI